MSHTPLTVPFHRMVSVPVTFRSTVLLAVLFTRLARTRGGRLPRVSPANPDPLMPLPDGYWISGNWPTVSTVDVATLTAFDPPVVNADVTASGETVGDPANSKLRPALDARLTLAAVRAVVAVSNGRTPSR